MVSINRTIRGAVDMTTPCVRAPPRKYLTPYKVSPNVMPVAAKTTSSPRMRSSRVSFFSESSSPYSLSLSTCERWVGHILAWISPPRHFITAAAKTPSGAPPIPMMPCSSARKPTAMVGVRSPSGRIWMRAPVSLIWSMRSSWRGLSRTATVISDGFRPFASAIACMFSATGASMSILPLACGPAMSLLMYMSGVLSIVPRGEAATAEMAPCCPFVRRCKPSTGSTARSTSVAPDPGPRLERPHLPLLVQPLLPQDSDLPRNGNSAELFPEALRGQGVGLLWRPGSFEARHLESYLLGHGRVLDGRRGHTPRAQPSQAHVGRSSPILSYPPKSHSGKTLSPMRDPRRDEVERPGDLVPNGRCIVDLYYTSTEPTRPPARSPNPATTSLASPRSASSRRPPWPATGTGSLSQ